MTQSEELKPCPFCGTERPSHGKRYGSSGDSGYFVECLDCPAVIEDDTEAEAIAAWNTRTPPNPSEPLVELHPATSKLVDDFASALKAKLLLSQQKYGWANEWARDDWKDECQRRLLDRLAKGDPRDVAAYCAFLWSHAWETAALPAPADDVVEALKWYARENNWRSCTVYMCGHGAINCNAMADKGNKARTALAKVNGDE